MKPLIGLVYDLRSEYLMEGYSQEDVAEFDSDATIQYLQEAIERCGYRTDRIGHAEALNARLTAGNSWDMVFNVAESIGGRSRESYVPALLEMYGIPYTFADPLVCALTLDKAMAKQIVSRHGLETPPFTVVETTDDMDAVALTYPLFAKPLAEGTGKGVDQNSKIENLTELRTVCEELLNRYHQPVLVEEFLPGREFTVGILGAGKAASVLGTMEIELISKDQPLIYSYLNKEECESRISYHPLLDNPILKQNVEQLALRSYQVLQCRDAGRVDIRCDRKNRPCFIEVNPLAGLHPEHSDLPMIATQEGMSYETLIGTILRNAFERIHVTKPKICKMC